MSDTRNCVVRLDCIDEVVYGRLVFHTDLNNGYGAIVEAAMDITDRRLDEIIFSSDGRLDDFLFEVLTSGARKLTVNSYVEIRTGRKMYCYVVTRR